MELKEECEEIHKRVFQRLTANELQYIVSRLDEIVEQRHVDKIADSIRWLCSQEGHHDCSFLCRLLLHVQRPDLVVLLLEEARTTLQVQTISHVLEISPPGFQVSAQLLHFKHRHFSQLHLKCYLDMNLQCACTGIEGYTAVLGLSSNREQYCLPSNDAQLLLSKLAEEVGEFENNGYIFLDILDSKEALVNQGIDLDHWDKDTNTFEHGFRAIMENATESLQSLMQELIKPCSCKQRLHSTDVNIILRQYLYWINSQQLSACLKEKALNYTQSGNATQLSSNSDVLFVCVEAFQPIAVMNWYQTRLIREIVSMVTDPACQLYLQNILEEMLNYER